MTASIRRPRGLVILGVLLAWAADRAPAAAPPTPPAPALKAARLTRAPKIDGRLKDACWRSAAVVRDFWVLDGSAKRSKAAWVKVAFDDQKIYFAFHLTADKTSGLRRGSRVRDTGVWGGPNVQVFLQPDAGGVYYCLTINSLNTQLDGIDGLQTWDGRWSSATWIAPDESFWQAEIAVPLAMLHLWRKKGPDVRMNLTCGVRLKGKTEYLTWAPAFLNFHNTLRFGALALPGLSWERWNGYAWGSAYAGPDGKLHAVAALRAAPKAAKDAEYVLEATMKGAGGKPVTASQSLRLRPGRRAAFREFAFALAGAGPCKFAMTLRDKASMRTIAHRLFAADAPPALEVWSDCSIYTHQTKARVRIRSAGKRAPDGPCRVTLRTAEGKEAVKPVQVSLKGGAAVAVFDIAALGPGRYVASVTTGKDGGGPGAACPLTKSAPRAGTFWYDDRGVIHKDRLPLFPVGIYSVRTHLDKGDLLKELAASAINTLVWEGVGAADYARDLARLAPHGLNLICSIQKERSVSEMRRRGRVYPGLPTQRAAQAVRDCAKGRPRNLLGWGVYERPGLHQEETVRRWARAAALQDPHSLTLVTTTAPAMCGVFASAVDALAVHTRGGAGSGRRGRIVERISAAVSAVRGRKPVIAVLDVLGRAPASKGASAAALPAGQELRCRTYLALVAGARGILYSSYDSDGPLREAHPRHWKMLKDLAGEIQRLAPALLADPNSRAVQQADGQKGLFIRTIRHGRDVYVLAVNSRRRKLEKVQWTVKGVGDGPLEVTGENRTITAQKGSFSDSFAPLAVHIYRRRQPSKP